MTRSAQPPARPSETPRFYPAPAVKRPRAEPCYRSCILDGLTRAATKAQWPAHDGRPCFARFCLGRPMPVVAGVRCPISKFPLGMMQTLCLPSRTFPRLNQLDCRGLVGALLPGTLQQFVPNPGMMLATATAVSWHMAFNCLSVPIPAPLFFSTSQDIRRGSARQGGPIANLRDSLAARRAVRCGHDTRAANKSRPARNVLLHRSDQSNGTAFQFARSDLPVTVMGLRKLPRLWRYVKPADAPLR